jgi:hypothetical protein
MARRLTILLAAIAAARAQSIAGPEREAEFRAAFEAAAVVPALRCAVSQIRPALDFGFHFQTGYQLDMPMMQFAGAGHEFTIRVRVVPENAAPVYLSTAMQLPDVPDMKSDAETVGRFVVGEGTYAVDLLVTDEQHRGCRSTWQIQARRTGNERLIAVPVPPGTVHELEADEPGGAASGKTGDIARLTILLHAAPLSPRRSKMEADDVGTFTETIATILRQWPARSVRLVAFNLDQGAVVLRNDRFDTGQIPELGKQLEQMELGVVTVRDLQNAQKPLDLVNGLIQGELRDPRPADAILILGPPGRWRDEVQSPLPEKRAQPAPLYYLQYPMQYRLPPGRIIASDPNGGGRGRGQYQPEGVPGMMPPPAMLMAVPDSIERLVAHFKGETMAIRTAHDLADAIHRIDPRIIRTTPPPQAAVTEGGASRMVPPVLPPATPPPVTEARGEAATDADPIDVLAALRDRVLANGRVIPNHTCVETVERSRYTHTGAPVSSCDAILAGRAKTGAAARLRLASTDRLRLDVALSSEREIYSWAGANKFAEGDIDEIVHQGAMGTGPFAAFLLSVFVGRQPRFVFQGEGDLDGHTVYEYSFHVSKDESRFRFKAHQNWIIAGYSGTLYVDPKTSDLARLIIRSEELPPETDTCEVDTTLDYGKVQLSGGVYFLASASTQRFIGRGGDEAENQYSFSACRDFRAQSNVDFGRGASDGSSAADRAADPPDWPSGLPVTIELTSPIDSASAAAGDRIQGRLLGPIRDARGNTLAPEGAVVTGRLMRVEVRHTSAQVTVVLRWETLDLGGREIPLYLRPRQLVTPGAGLQTGGLASLATAAVNLRRRGTEFELPLPGEERYGTYHMPGLRYSTEGGLRTEWVTIQH